MSRGTCGRCGQVHGKCTAHNRRGGPCGQNPLADQDVCHLHGGKSPAALAEARTKAVERAAEAELRRRWAHGAEAAVADPLSELARLAGEVVAFKDYLRDQVTDLNGVLAYWTEETFETDEAIRTQATEQLRAVVTAYERSLDRAAKVLANIVKLDLAGRLLEVRTEQARLIVDAVRHGLAQVDMPAEVRRGAQEAIADAIAGLSRPQPKGLTA